MFKEKTIAPMRLTLRALARLLAYPDADLRAQAPALAGALREENALPAARLDELDALCRRLARNDPYELEEHYVDTFDRSRRASLHLFEHVYGDSRDRGPALIDLGKTYAEAGLHLGTGELPDYLPVVLEFASTQPPETAREFLGETTHILNALFSALIERTSPYASVIAAAIEAAGEQAQQVPVAPEPPLDEEWAEPPAFDGCSTTGQSRPQTFHARRTQPATPTQGVST